jgi:hypothetical protein
MRIAAIFLLATLAAVSPARSEEAASASANEQPTGSDAASETLDADYWVPPRAAAKLAIATPPYRSAVQRSLDFARKQCREEGGRSLAFRPDIVRRGDLNGDGRDDYIVDFRGAVCAERLYMFNGTGGWDLEIFVSQGRTRLVPVFAGRVRGYDLSNGPGPHTMAFELHGGFCGKAGVEECLKTRKITGRRFEFRDR